MIEFHVKIRINTQSPEIAYEHLRGALSYSGLTADINEVWLQNNSPLNPAVAHRTHNEWAKRTIRRKDSDDKIQLRGTERDSDRYEVEDITGPAPAHVQKVFYDSILDETKPLPRRRKNDTL